MGYYLKKISVNRQTVVDNWKHISEELFILHYTSQKSFKVSSLLIAESSVKFCNVNVKLTRKIVLDGILLTSSCIYMFIYSLSFYIRCLFCFYVYIWSFSILQIVNHLTTSDPFCERVSVEFLLKICVCLCESNKLKHKNGRNYSNLILVNF